MFVISRVADDAMVPDVETWSIRVSGWNADVSRAVSPLADVIAVPDTAFDGAALLASISGKDGLARLTEALVAAGASIRSTAFVGSHAARYTVKPHGAGA